MKRKGKKEAWGQTCNYLVYRNGIFPYDPNFVSNVDTTL